jgi:hypothetical protein
MLDKIKQTGYGPSVSIQLTPSMIRIAENIAALQNKYRLLEEDQRVLQAQQNKPRPLTFPVPSGVFDE